MAFWHRHKDYYSQNMSLLNEGWLADPIATYAGIAVVNGDSIAESVQQGIRTGGGARLLKYYQYSTRRYKERNYHWYFQRISSDNTFINRMSEVDLEKLDPRLKGVTKRIVSENTEYEIGGAKFNYDMQNLYGLDSFNTDYNGQSIMIGSLTNAEVILKGSYKFNTSYQIGYDNVDGTKPVVILGSNIDLNQIEATVEYEVLDKTDYSPEPSKGIIYWTSSKGLENSPIVYNKEEELQTTDSDLINFIISNGKTKGSTVISETTDWKDPRYNYSVGRNDTDEVVDGSNTAVLPNTEKDVNIETITYTHYVVVSYDDEDRFSRSLIYDKYETRGTIVYDKEVVLWATKTQENITGLRNYYEEVKEAFSVEDSFSSRKKDTTFKFFPYIPIREGYQWFLDVNHPNFKKIADASYTVDRNIDKSDANSLESDTNSGRLASKQRKKARTGKKREVAKAERILGRSNNYLRAVNTSSYIRTNKSKSRLERDLNEMGDLLGLNYKSTVANLYSTEGIKDAYDIWLQPAVLLATDKNDVMLYWEKFWERLYKLTGDGGYSKFKAGVLELEQEAAKNNQRILPVNKLPLYRLDFSSEPNSHHMNHNEAGFNGSISFAFIKKFRIKGNIRKIKRKKQLRDIKRGKIRYFETIKLTEVNELLNPLEEFADDKYFTTKSGKDIHIGGDSAFPNSPDAGWVNDVTFRRWGYTFFCKRANADEIDVIAVAGLCARTTVHNDGSYQWANAWYELNMYYQRNHKRYVEHKSIKDRDVSYSHTTGSKKRRKINRIHYFFAVPLDYNVCRKMGGVNLTRFADRSVVVMSWSHQHVKRLAGWVAGFIKVIGIIIAIAISYFTSGTGAKVGASFLKWASGALANISLKAILTKIATTVLINMAVKYGLEALAKVFGLKGLLAIIIAVMALVLASQSGMGVNLSSLPYGSEVAKTVIAEGVNTYNEIIQDKIKDIQDAIIKEQEAFTEAMDELEDKQEDFNSSRANYDIKEILASLTERVLHPEEYFARTLESNPNVWASEEFLSNFFNQKLMLDMNYFDLESSTDFSFNDEDEELLIM